MKNTADIIAVPNGTKLSHLCMNPGHEPGTVDNENYKMVQGAASRVSNGFPGFESALLLANSLKENTNLPGCWQLILWMPTSLLLTKKLMTF